MSIPVFNNFEEFFGSIYKDAYTQILVEFNNFNKFPNYKITSEFNNLNAIIMKFIINYLETDDEITEKDVREHISKTIEQIFPDNTSTELTDNIFEGFNKNLNSVIQYFNNLNNTSGGFPLKNIKIISNIFAEHQGRFTEFYDAVCEIIRLFLKLVDDHLNNVSVISSVSSSQIPPPAPPAPRAAQTQQTSQTAPPTLPPTASPPTTQNLNGGKPLKTNKISKNDKKSKTGKTLKNVKKSKTGKTSKNVKKSKTGKPSKNVKKSKTGKSSKNVKKSKTDKPSKNVKKSKNSKTSKNVKKTKIKSGKKSKPSKTNKIKEDKKVMTKQK